MGRGRAEGGQDTEEREVKKAKVKQLRGGNGGGR